MNSVVIVGSGFTGFECARQLARGYYASTTSPSPMISPVDYMLYTPLFPRCRRSCRCPLCHFPLANSLHGVRAVRGRVDTVDFAQHRLLSIPRGAPRCRGIGWC